jgi:hypothetical protein
MSNNTSNFPAGYIPITTSNLEPGAGNPRDSALLSQQNANVKLANLNSSVGGKRKKYNGGANGVPAPQFQMQYTPTGGPGTSPNNQIATITTNSMQSNAWNVDDNQATKMGGKRKTRKGGSSDWMWGCYSGGKKSRLSKRKSHKTRKPKKKTRRHHKRH